jgi:hypothetical protein
MLGGDRGAWHLYTTSILLQICNQFKVGIPHDRIVLAFKLLDIRAHTDFAVA